MAPHIKLQGMTSRERQIWRDGADVGWGQGMLVGGAIGGVIGALVVLLVRAVWF